MLKIDIMDDDKKTKEIITQKELDEAIAELTKGNNDITFNKYIRKISKKEHRSVVKTPKNVG